MTGRIFDIKRFAVHDGDGVRTTVFFKGCPLHCLWCHNPESISRNYQMFFFEHKCTSCGACAGVCENHKIINGKHIYERDKCNFCGKCAEICPNDALSLQGYETTVEELMPKLLADRTFYETSGGGVTLSGGECLLQPDFALELLKALKKEGINTAVDTCGCVSREIIDKVRPYTDTFLYDVKAFHSDVHKDCTGVGNELILSNLRHLVSVCADIEVRIPVVPGKNDFELPYIKELLSELGIKKVKELAYHDLARSKYRALDMPDTLP